MHVATSVSVYYCHYQSVSGGDLLTCCIILFRCEVCQLSASLYWLWFVARLSTPSNATLAQLPIIVKWLVKQDLVSRQSLPTAVCCTNH